MDAGHLIGEDRLSWDYFNRLHAGLGKTMAIRENWRGRGAQAVRIAESVVHCGLCMGRSALTGMAGKNSTHNLARCQSHLSGSLLRERWRLFKSGGPIQ